MLPPEGQTLKFQCYFDTGKSALQQRSLPRLWVGIAMAEDITVIRRDSDGDQTVIKKAEE